MRKDDLPNINLCLKRAMDIALAAVGLIVAAPLWCAMTALILLETGRPVFFRAVVAGKDGKPFQETKFRTMHQEYGRLHREQQIGGDYDPKHDPRLTKVGRVLRPMALDELPALWHILRGEMSFVGPRTLPFLVNDPRDPDYRSECRSLRYGMERLRVRPGLTGIAQLYCAKNLAWRKKFRYDALYIRKMSLWLDIKLVAMSFLRTFARRWEQVQTRRLR